MKTHGNSRKLQKTQFPQFSPVFRSFPQFSPVFPSFSQFFPVFPSFPQFLWPLKPQFSYARAEKMTGHQIDKKKRIKNISSISPKFNFLQFCPVLPSSAQFFPVLSSFHQFCWVFLPISPSFAQFCPVLPSFAQFCAVLPSFAQFCPVFFNFSQFCPELVQFEMFQSDWLSLIELIWILNLGCLSFFDNTNQQAIQPVNEPINQI